MRTLAATTAATTTAPNAIDELNSFPNLIGPTMINQSITNRKFE